MGTDRFSRHLQVVKPQSTHNRLTPDANFSRNVAFHVIRTPEGEDLWLGRYLTDLLEVAAECHPEGLLVEIDGFEYLLTVAPAPKEPSNG